MSVGIPVHLLATHELALRRASAGGLSGWQSPLGDTEPYWTGQGYVSLPLSRAVSSDESGVQQGSALFYFEGTERPKASDKLLVDGVELEVVAVRPPNRLIDYWKLDVKTGAS